MPDCSAAYFMYFARYDVTPCSPVILYLGTTRPRTLAGAQLYMLARDLLEIKTLKKAEK